MCGHVRLGLLVAAVCLCAAPANAQPFPNDAFLESQLVPDARQSVDDVLFNRGTRLDLVLQDVFEGAWIGVDYLNYRISGPAEVALGVPLADLEDPTQSFEVTGTDDTTILNARVPVLRGINFNHMDGIKGSFGIPIGNRGWIEGSAWGLGTETSFAQTDPLPLTSPLGTGPFGSPGIRLLATTLNGNGTAGNRLIIYDNDFSARYQADVWSGEANLVFNVETPQDGFRLQSLAGFRHLQYDEGLSFGGTFTNISDFNTGAGLVTNPLTTNITSKAHNNLYGGQLGFRAEYVAERFTLGFEPKVIFSNNQTTADVNTTNLRAAVVDDRTPDPLVIPPDQRLTFLTDPATTSHSSVGRFSPGLDLGLYAKVRVTSWMNVKVGYNLLWLGNLSTPENNIFYNDDGDRDPALPNTPGVVVQQTSFSDRVIDGLSIGGEILLP